MAWNKSELIIRTDIFCTKVKGQFNVVKILRQFYEIDKKGSGFVVGTFEKRLKLNSQNKGHLMRIIQINDNIQLVRNK